MKSEAYGKTYFDWQSQVGIFGARANQFKFVKFIKVTDSVLDFGCGGGYLLEQISCAEKYGIEPNPEAREKIPFTSFSSSRQAMKEIPSNAIDRIISNHALEHVVDPLSELKVLFELLKPSGTIHFVVPCESYKFKFSKNDINHHLFSFSPQNLGNLFQLAGFDVMKVEPIFHKWPPRYQLISKLGMPTFHLISRIWGYLNRSMVQVRITARKP